MMRIRYLFLLASLTLLTQFPSPAHAWRGRVGIGIGIGIPIGGYGYYGPYGYGPYYRPYPYGYYPPVVVGAPPIVVQQQPPVIMTQPPGYNPTPFPGTQGQPPPPPPQVMPQATNAQANVNAYLSQLNQADEGARANAVTELGRMRAEVAVDSLAAVMANDKSPTVRDAAARALGLIGSTRALPALTQAAQADPDREVRRSAQYAIEVIRVTRR